MKRIIFITGYYGSGKTEIALNLAVKLNVDYLVDLDVINPYFRSRAYKGLLNEIDVISSDLNNDQFSDLPYISKRIFLPFRKPDVKAIYDLGGNDLGAKLMNQFAQNDLNDAELFFVINTFRMETSSVKDIIAVLKKIEVMGHKKVTGLIHNSHLLSETTITDIKDREHMVIEVSKQTEIPIVYTCINEQLDDNDETFVGKTLKIKRYFQKKWLT